jgi:hypothetical protein
MRALIALVTCALLLSRAAVAADTAPAPELCRQEAPLVRKLWLHSLYDAPAAIDALMVDAIDGKLPQVRQQLARLKPADMARWRQTAMLTAAYAGQTAVVDGLLDDGAAVDGAGWIPPMQDNFYRLTVDNMKHDPHFGGPHAVKALSAAGLIANRPQQIGPAIIAAADCGDLATLDVLLRHHANLGWRSTPHSADALVIATVHGDAAIVQRLLDHGADPCIDDRFIQSHKPGASLATISQHSGLPASLTRRLSCPAVAAVH